MRVREVMLAGVRGYPELRRVSFVDPLTDRVRQLTVIAGSNGTGKTTFLEAIYELLGWDSNVPPAPGSLLSTVLSTRSAGAALVIDRWPGTPGARLLAIRCGDSSELADALSPDHSPSTLAAVFHGVLEGAEGFKVPRFDARRDGLLYFSHNRWVQHQGGGAIESPTTDNQWLWRFEGKNAWKGSLSQLWVWQNYLDLEEGREGRPNLTPFVELVETVLGRGRTVRIHKGRVTIEGGGRPAVEPHQLPSGEQQILTLFGELGRRLRPGAVVMIDEVEISLHPALQRKVIAILRDLAAKYDLQIIVTTHSTEILRAVDPSEVVSLDDLES